MMIQGYDWIWWFQYKNKCSKSRKTHCISEGNSPSDMMFSSLLGRWWENLLPQVHRVEDCKWEATMDPSHDSWVLFVEVLSASFRFFLSASFRFFLMSFFFPIKRVFARVIKYGSVRTYSKFRSIFTSLVASPRAPPGKRVAWPVGMRLRILLCTRVALLCSSFSIFRSVVFYALCLVLGSSLSASKRSGFSTRSSLSGRTDNCSDWRWHSARLSVASGKHFTVVICT